MKNCRLKEKQLKEFLDVLEEKYCDFSKSSGKFYEEVTSLWEGIWSLATYKLVCLEPSFFDKGDNNDFIHK